MSPVSDNNNILLPHHEAQLLKSSISKEVIQARGYRSVSDKHKLERLGFASYQQQIPGLLIPQFSIDGQKEPYTYLLRPDKPRTSGKKGRVIKYEAPAGCDLRFDVNPTVKGMVKQADIPRMNARYGGGYPGTVLIFSYSVLKCSLDDLYEEVPCNGINSGAKNVRNKRR